MVEFHASRDDEISAPAATQVEQAVRDAPDHLISPSEKQALAREASREEDA